MPLLHAWIRMSYETNTEEEIADHLQYHGVFENWSHLRRGSMSTQVEGGYCLLKGGLELEEKNPKVIDQAASSKASRKRAAVESVALYF